MPPTVASPADSARPGACWHGCAFSGYALGALMAGTLADLFGMRAAIMAVAVLTGLSGLVVARRMPETLAPANDV